VRSKHWKGKRFLGDHPRDQEIECMLRSELTDAFGRSDDLFQEMKVKAIFKGFFTRVHLLSKKKDAHFRLAD
jgi:hypothetical protein